MDYRRFGDTIVVRMDLDEEILEQLKVVAEKEHIKLATVDGLGAAKSFVTGVYSVPEQKYYSTEHTGAFEIVSLHGSIDTMNGEFYTHIHASFSNHEGNYYGGHLNAAVIGGTGEIFIRIIDGQIDREKDPVVGLNVFKFN